MRRGGDAARACLEALVPQVEAAGGELIVVVSGDVPADALPAIKKACRVPLVADIHFNHRFALKAISAGVDKVRLNPGNVGGKERVQEVVSRLLRRDPDERYSDAGTVAAALRG